MKRQSATSLDDVISAKRESKYLDFKEKFDPDQLEDRCEIIKDMTAMANSGGGWILVGVKDNGQPSNSDVSPVLSLDTAKITDQFAKYTDEQFADFHIQEAHREGHTVAAIHIEGASIPLVFIRPGTYETQDKKQKTSFSKGTVYFRHGSKSEPGNTNDLRKSVERQLEHTRKSWLGNIRKVVSAPSSHKVVILPAEVQETDAGGAYPIRIVDDPNAPAYKKVWDESAYSSPQEMLVGILKSWKGNKASFASEADLWSLYEARNILDLDEDKAECLLESAINRHAPFFFWATHLSKEKLYNCIRRIAGEGKYPAPNMVLKLAHAVGGKEGSELIDFVANNSKYRSVKGMASRLKKSIMDKNRLKKVHGSTTRIGTRTMYIEEMGNSGVEDLINEAIKLGYKQQAKCIDVFFYGQKLEMNNWVG